MQDYLEKKIDSELAIAKKNAKTNKRAALQAIKRKKRFEKQLGQIDGTLTTLEQQREALEGANTNTAVLQVLLHAQAMLHVMLQVKVGSEPISKAAYIATSCVQLTDISCECCSIPNLTHSGVINISITPPPQHMALMSNYYYNILFSTTFEKNQYQ